MKQKIKLPSNCQHLDLTDDEKVIANLLLNIAFLDYKQSEKAQMRDWMKTEYYFVADDLGRIMNTEKLCGTTILRNAFRIGRLNEHTIAVSFQKAVSKTYGSPDFYYDTITTTKALKMHSYLMGRFSYPEGIINKDSYMYTSIPLKINAYAISEI